ncbi:unsaturated rhamnogalacturonyl hydrolase [Paenibacillus algorifonticola]|uniref:Unsaturated rhamnogalacturonyl hydrolase n=1 Tax=Paenibacillus algorifonticola TaxID=684063 RepID=A0A1I2GII7_9BACL|nr:glycoside hydrolase family 88 protein [Paenibacillus algorifonticola]SFF17048.1 unsaturated rhamnogalacturonyl hydrolase [Paenibacillus algorifonticola]
MTEQQQQVNMTGWAGKIADTIMSQCDSDGYHDYPMERWAYVPGMLLMAMARAGIQLNEKRYYHFMQLHMDHYIEADGTIRSYTLEEYNLDQINQGKNLFFQYENTVEKRYSKAADTLAAQLISQPRTSEGGFWHKKVYPFQMWLDGLYMASPFLAEYAKVFDRPELLSEVAHQLLLVERRTRDKRTGLLYHGWDESGEQEWADSLTGLSSHFWSRAMGWYAMALVDCLEHFPVDHPKRGTIIGIFQRMCHALVDVQDQGSGLWYQVLDQGKRKGNYLEATGSIMFVYAMAKGLRLRYLEPGFRNAMLQGYEGIIRHLVTEDSQGVHLHQICHGAGLSKDRNGSFDYYISEAVVSDHYMGIGPLLLASLEVERYLE